MKGGWCDVWIFYLLWCPVQGQSTHVSGDEVDVAVGNGNVARVIIGQTLVVLHAAAIQLVPQGTHPCKHLGHGLVERGDDLHIQADFDFLILSCEREWNSANKSEHRQARCTNRIRSGRERANNRESGGRAEDVRSNRVGNISGN